MQPRSCRTSAIPLMPAPPIPIKCAREMVFSPMESAIREPFQVLLSFESWTYQDMFTLTQNRMFYAPQTALSTASATRDAALRWSSVAAASESFLR